MTMMPAEDRARLEAALAEMSPDERAKAAVAAEAYYWQGRNARYRANLEKAVRYNYADRRSEGAAAARRRKQMERDRAK